MVVGDGRLQDSEFCNIRERGRERDHQRSFRAETPLITNTRAPPCHDPPILPPPLTHTHTSTPTSCANPPVKLTPTIPLPKHAALCQQALVSSKQRNQKCEGFLRHGRGLLIPSYWLFLSFFLLPSYVLKERKERIAISFLRASLLSPRFFLPFSHLSRSFMPLCVHLHGHDEGPHASWLGSLKGLRRDGERQGEKREMALRP